MKAWIEMPFLTDKYWKSNIGNTLRWLTLRFEIQILVNSAEFDKSTNIGKKMQCNTWHEKAQVTDPETNETNEHRDFAIAEAIFITWFTIEYCVRYTRWLFSETDLHPHHQVRGVPVQVGLHQGEHECDRLVGHCPLLHLPQVEFWRGQDHRWGGGDLEFRWKRNFSLSNMRGVFVC